MDSSLKTSITSDTNCRFEGIPKIILIFHNSLGSLTELAKSFYTPGNWLITGKGYELELDKERDILDRIQKGTTYRAAGSPSPMES